MSPANMAGQFGDTTYTKVFVGGLAWETHKETLRNYFAPFGEILEAVVITDKNTGRSKGYGFVTFREPEASMRACVDPAPVIDGRRANCNLASLGVQKSAPATPSLGASKSFKVMKSFQSGLLGGMGAAFPSVSFPHYGIQQGIPCNVYGYPPYSPEYTHPMGYYNVYGGATAHYPVYGGTPGLVPGNTAFYPYLQFGQGLAAYGHANGYGMQYPQMVQQYSTVTSTAAVTGFAPPPHYGGVISLASPPAQGGMKMALAIPTPPTPAAQHYIHIPTRFTGSTQLEQPLA